MHSECVWCGCGCGCVSPRLHILYAMDSGCTHLDAHTHNQSTLLYIAAHIFFHRRLCGAAAVCAADALPRFLCAGRLCRSIFLCWRCLLPSFWHSAGALHTWASPSGLPTQVSVAVGSRTERFHGAGVLGSFSGCMVLVRWGSLSTCMVL